MLLTKLQVCSSQHTTNADAHSMMVLPPIAHVPKAAWCYHQMHICSCHDGAVTKCSSAHVMLVSPPNAPLLSTFIRDIALACWTVPASQGSCERAWANLSRQSSAIRSRLLPEKKAKITMLEANWHLLLGDTSQETRARERCLKRSLPSLAAGLSRDMAKRARNLVAQQRQQDFEPAPGSDDESDCHPLSSSSSSSSSSP